MRVGFAGTPVFAVAALEAIVRAGHEVPLVLTRADAPQGRGLRVASNPVKRMAGTLGLPVEQPRSLREGDIQVRLAGTEIDVLVVAAYGLILPAAVLAWPRLGCVNIHASRLPRWRGAAPIQRAILAGDRETGISIMRMDEGLDTGPVISQHTIAIAARETGASLTSRLAALGAHQIVNALERIAATDRIDSVPQDADGVTYAKKIERSETDIDWRESAIAIDRKVRAFDPVPGGRSTLAGEPIKIWASDVREGFGDPGAVVAVDTAGIHVACGAGVLVVVELQRPGGRRVPAHAYLAGHPLELGARLGTHSAAS